MTIPEFDDIIEQNDQTTARREHLERLRELVGNAYPNKFERSRVTGDEDTITRLVNFADITKHIPRLGDGERPSADVKDAANTELKKLGTVRIAGRLATPPRLMGKAAFVHLSDGISRIQIYVRRDDVRALVNGSGESVSSVDSVVPTSETIESTEETEGTGGNPHSALRNPQSGWEVFQLLDHGDFIGVEGFLFITNTGELSVHVEKLQFLSKAMLPMPDKMHGISDPEIRQRQRYADLIASSLQIEHDGLTTRQVFETRAKVISSVRRFLEDHGYIEVETPMLTPKATGAAAKPFETHHNALDITLYARIAPELYLKRLVVGGFEKVYELNRNFRNEGISFKHNPEFTMLEFYCAYMDVNGMMDFCEELLRQSVQNATGGLVVEYEGKTIDFGKFERITMREAVERAGGNPIGSEGALSDNLLLEAFENNVEAALIQPTFIIDFPKSISPLSKASPEDPQIAERFELFVNGMEVANGFSELNDPREQYERFVDQMSERERGDEEAMVLDEDYIRALSYGMPPAAGIGIGIDRLVMLLTNKHSIRDVILFPHLRPERKTHDIESDG
ncbi:MAG TPA: lysine--tRNA ligase [Pyrinomonadaceae bacterium]